MSPIRVQQTAMMQRFPRVSGDEPVLGASNPVRAFGFPRVSGDEPRPKLPQKAPETFSPRERG